MSQKWLNYAWQLGLVNALVISVNLTFSNCVYAQSAITPDITLGSESSQISPVVNATQNITGGAQRGSNLFHSFQEFNVNDGQSIFFRSPNNIENIVARVTGNNVSQILGTLGTRQLGNSNSVAAANLLLINPNGIIFGPNAELNIGGSFLGSTASAIKLADGTLFSATSPQTLPLLTISTPIGLQFGTQTAGDILFQSSFIDIPIGKTLALVGGNVTLDGETILIAESGQIAIGGLQGTGTVDFNLNTNNQPLIFPNNIPLADVSLKDMAIVDVSVSPSNFTTNSSGQIQVQGRKVTLTNGSRLVASTQVETDRGISLKAEELTVEGGSQIRTFTFGAGRGGSLTINASNFVQVSGTDADGSPSALIAESETSAQGAAGNLTIDTSKLIVEGGAKISTSTLNGSQGNGGILTVKASDFVQVSGTDPNGRPSSLIAETFGQGNAGNLTIDTSKLIVEGGANIAAAARQGSEGNGGILTVNASDFVLLSGISPVLSDRPSGLFAQTESTGNAGSLTINTRRLIVQKGAVVTAGTLTGSTGNGGTLTVRATESVELNSTGAKQFPSGLFARTRGTGNAGSLNIVTPQLTVRDNAIVTVDSLGSGNAGNLDIEASSVRLDNQGKITAATTSGQGGNISLRNLDVLLLQGNSQITTNADTARVGADVAGGNIDIDSTLIVATPGENSDITANAFRGRGGNINITTDGLFGIERRDRLTPQNDITAASDFGINGTIQINTPDVEPSKGIVALPEEVADASQAIAQSCSTTESKKHGEIVITGRGGLPPSPDPPLSNDVVWSDTRLISITSQPHSSNHPPTKLTSSLHTTKIVPATGWVFNQQGEVTLIAHTPNVTPYNLRHNSSSCHI